MPSDEELDELVRLSDTARTPAEVGLSARGLAVRDRILQEGRHRRRTSSRRYGALRWRSLSLSLAVATLVAGGGTVAVATSGLETPWGWIADNVFTEQQADSELCFQGLRIEFEGESSESEIVKQARAILASLDLSRLDTSRATQELRDDVTTNLDGTEGSVDLSPAELKMAAVHKTVADTLFAELEAAGFEIDDYPVSLYSRSNDCD